MAALGELRLGDRVYIDGCAATGFRVTRVLDDQVAVESPAIEGTAPISAVHRVEEASR